MGIPCNPFAEGLQKHERLVAFTSGYTLLKYIFFSKNPVLDATVGKSSPLYSVNLRSFYPFLIEVRK
jgi:hypothetical protein